MKKIILLIQLFMLHFVVLAQLPAVISGTLQRIENFKSAFVTQRNIDIWLPPNYSIVKKYPVLYMHDGQMLYDSSITWNKQAWNVDDVLTEMINGNKAREVIIVGIWNNAETRHPDYFPQKPYELLTAEEKNYITQQLQIKGRINATFKPVSDNYLKFLVKELKPYIDQHYSTYRDRKNTFIAGSSMGGLISIYAICEYPKIFGGAACLSTHWPGIFTMDNNPVPAVMLKYLKKHLPATKSHKIYFDCGDKTLDAFYPPIQQKIDALMRNKGFSEKNWITKYYPGEDHSENAWGRRLHIPILFLLGK